MQVVTTVKTTIQEVKKALRLLNQNLPSEFVLEIDYNTKSVDTEHNQDTTEQQSQPWYPDDSGEWIETYGKKPQNLSEYDWIDVPKDWKHFWCPTGIDRDTAIDIIQRNGEKIHNVLVHNIDNLWSQDNYYADIVKYRVSK